MRTIGHHLGKKTRQFHPRNVIVMTLAAAAVLIAAPLASKPAVAPLCAYSATSPSTDASSGESSVSPQLSRFGLDWQADATPSFGPLPATGDASAGM